MKIVSQRTSMPFDNRGSDGNASISPLTQKSIMPFNNVWTIQDILNGRKYDGLLQGGGDWSRGEDVEKSYREEGNDYKREVRDAEMLNTILNTKEPRIEQWKVKFDGGAKFFSSFDAAQRFKEQMKDKLHFLYITKVAKVAKTNTLKIAQNSQLHAIINSSIKKCVMLKCVDSKNGVMETGSGFCVAPNYFLTCAHVIKKYNKNKGVNKQEFFDQSVLISIVQENNQIPAKLIDVDPILDVALVYCELPIEPFQLDYSIDYFVDTHIGDEILTIGSPRGYENNVTVGNIGSLNRKIYYYPNAPEYMFVDLSVFPGNSGGPVIRQSDGKVVGIITLIITDAGGYGLNAALTSNYIENFIKKNIRGG